MHVLCLLLFFFLNKSGKCEGGEGVLQQKNHKTDKGVAPIFLSAHMRDGEKLRISFFAPPRLVFLGAQKRVFDGELFAKKRKYLELGCRVFMTGHLGKFVHFLYLLFWEQNVGDYFLANCQFNILAQQEQLEINSRQLFPPKILLLLLFQNLWLGVIPRSVFFPSNPMFLAQSIAADVTFPNTRSFFFSFSSYNTGFPCWVMVTGGISSCKWGVLTENRRCPATNRQQRDQRKFEY